MNSSAPSLSDLIYPNNQKSPHARNLYSHCFQLKYQSSVND